MHLLCKFVPIRHTFCISFTSMAPICDPAAIVYLCRVMFQDTGHRLLTAHSRVRSETSSCDVYFGHTGLETGFFPPENFGFPLSLSFRQFSILFNSSITSLHNLVVKQHIESKKYIYLNIQAHHIA